MTDFTSDSAAPRRRWLRGQFSLREMLLAMTAICGLAAAFYTNRGLKPTVFLSSFRPQQVLDPIVKAAHPTNLSYGSVGGAQSDYNGRSAEQEQQLSYDVTTPTAEDLLNVLRVAIVKALQQDGCSIIGRSTSGDGFGFQYENGGTVGFVSVYGFQFPDRIKIGYLAYEHR